MDRDPSRQRRVAKHGRRRRVGHQLVEMVERTDDLERTRLELGVVDDQHPALAARQRIEHGGRGQAVVENVLAGQARDQVRRPAGGSAWPFDPIPARP